MPPRPPRSLHAGFARRLVAWQRVHGRHDLPWQGTRDVFRIWVAEIMLQQTQVATVTGYYARFLAKFPGVAQLAAASEDEVLALWSGLGYYARARNLHRAAREVMARHAGRIPASFEALLALPGIGRSTAGAIAAFAAGERRAILDGNVKRVLARHFAIEGAATDKAVADRLWSLAESLLPASDIEAYTQALMDLGAGVCTRSRPACEACPVRATCIAWLEGRIAQLPGRGKPVPSPLRSTMLVLAVSKGAVLVEKRPPAGIWGGLWSLPEAPAGADPAVWSAANLGLVARRVDAMEPFVHAFTHFRLAVTPYFIDVGRRGRVAADGMRQWLAIEAAGEAALPAPVKKLIASLRSR